jgi:hypothetical protein
MHEVQGAEEAVEDGDHVVFGEIELLNGLEDLFEIGLHVLHHDEDVREIVWVRRSDDVKNFGGELTVYINGQQSVHHQNF